MYNAELYSNYTEAEYSPRGIAIVAVFLSVKDYDNPAFNILKNQFLAIKAKVACFCPEVTDEINSWWSYDGHSGPDDWATHNPDWFICKSGKNQSPINIIPETLLYDPLLKTVMIEPTLVNGILWNTMKDITFIIHNNGGSYVNITSGPLSYMYRLYQIKFHYGIKDRPGSEHRIDGKAFPGEIHFMAYNVELYSNYTEAEYSPRGIAIVAVFLSVNGHDNPAFNILKNQFLAIKAKGTALKDVCTEIKGFPIGQLLPKTNQYMTYSGSLTQPGCRETVTWIVFNKPTYISYEQMRKLREEPYQEWQHSNTRPLMPLNHRTVRTNINFKKRNRLCSMEVAKSYKVNPVIGQ